MVGVAVATSADTASDDAVRQEYTSGKIVLTGVVFDDEKAGSVSGGGSGSVSGGVATFAAPIGIIEPPPEVKSPQHNTQPNATHQLHSTRSLSLSHLLSSLCVPSPLPFYWLSVVIDRTAEFVRKTGSAGEEQLLAKNRNNKKFAFLTQQSPFHSYYKHRVAVGANQDSNTQEEQRRSEEEEERSEKRRVDEEAEESRRKREEEEAEARKPRTLQQRLESLIEASRLDGKSTSMEATAATSPPPPPLPFLTPHPSHYSSSELDVVHLTALYSSHLGGGFLSSLQQRERTNSAFDFLKPQHPLHSYYTATRHAIDRILRQQTAPLLAEYGRFIHHPPLLLARLMAAARRKRQQQVEEEGRQREAQEDTEVMAAIDWQSFVVVETVDFAADEVDYLPQPKQTIQEMEAMIAELAIEEEREREERDRLDSERRKQERQEQEAMQLEAAAAAEAAVSMAAHTLSSTHTAAGAVIEHSNELLEVRTSSVPAAVSVAAAGVAAAPSTASKLVTCVVCGDTIAAEDLEEHLRIELLDPQWKEQKQTLIDRQRETSLVAGKSISDNLRRFERKKREIGRERSREEEARQEREDALLLRGAAREQTNNNSAASPLSASPPAVLPTTPYTTATSASSASPVAPSSSPLLTVAEEPIPKRVRPTSPALTTPLAPATATPAASTASFNPSVLASSAVTSALAAVPPSSSLTAVEASESLSSDLSAPPSAPSSAPSLSKQPTAQLVDESVWMSAHPMELTVIVRVPLDSASPYQLAGQSLSVLCRLSDSVDVLRAAVSVGCNGLPANRQQFQLLTGAFLKENHSLAYYNVYDGAMLALKIKERGGKRK